MICPVTDNDCWSNCALYCEGADQPLTFIDEEGCE